MLPILTVIIPVLNGGAELSSLLEKILAQSIVPDEIIVTDSESTDGSADVAAHYGAKVIPIKRKDFDHGGTRALALNQSIGDIILFITQDAVPADRDYIAHLIRPFEDPAVAAVSGRQIAKPNATLYEQYVREYRYPAQSSVWDQSDISVLGIRAYQISDVCSAYRRTAYQQVGGFAHPLMTNEDMLIAADFLESGFRIAYAADAVVLHSHNYTFKQEYRRNRLIGRFMEHYGHRFRVHSEVSEGKNLFMKVSIKLLKHGAIWSFVRFVVNCIARFLGNRAGRWLEAHPGKQ